MLSKIISRIRRKLQTERLLKGAAIVAGSLLAISLLASLALARSNFSDDAIFWIRICGAAGILVLLYRFLVRPSLRPPTAKQVARFVEERNPELQERMSTAVELEGGTSNVHPEIRQLIIHDARKRFQRIPQPRFYFPRASLSSLAGALIAVLVFGILYWSGPGAYNYSLSRLLGALDDEATPLYSIQVNPGSVKIGKHADLEVQASLHGFSADSVKVFVQYSGQPQWEEAKMLPDSRSGGYSFLFFDVREPFLYYVEADGIRSDQFKIQVSEIPRVLEMKVRLEFPKYTGLDPLVLEEEGDIRALKGTRAHFTIKTDQPIQAAKIQLDSGADVELQVAQPRLLEGEIKIDKDDFYRIHLADLEGVWNPGSDEFLIQALEDQIPILSFTIPGRDRKVTNLEEIFVEAKAEDDYGIRRLSLIYSVNGAEEQEVKLDHPRYSRSFKTSHTFYMEEFELLPGDFVSYYAKAVDAVSSSATDLYFLEVEPFEKEISQGQQGQQGQGQESIKLAKQQKDILVATFKLEQNRSRIPANELEENGQTLALIQQQLQIQAQTIIDRIQRRGAAASDPRFQEMVEYITTAIGHMEPAHDFLNELKTSEAIPEEQKSLQNLLRAESLFNEIQVSFSQSSSSSSSAEDLADLVDLELDQTKNQYETLQQNRAVRQEQALDEALEKLKDLAKRQEQQVERQKRQGRRSNSSAGGNMNQDQLIEEAEELARELERLSRHKRDPQLAESARQLRQAIRDMRRAQAGSRSEQEAQMRAQQALDQLKKAQQSLGQQRENQLQQSMENLQQQARQLQSKQEEIIEKTQRLRKQLESSQFDSDFNRQRLELRRLKNESQEDIQKLESDLHQAARQMASKEPDSAKSLKSAALSVRDERIADQMRGAGEFSRQLMYQQAESLERLVKSDLEDLSEKIDQAKQAMGTGPQSDDPMERLQRAQNQLNSAIEDLESLRQRAQSAQGQAEQGQQQQGQEPQQTGRQPGQQDQPGQQQGEQGQQQGQEGRPQDQQGRQQGEDSRSSQSPSQSGQEGPTNLAGPAPNRAGIDPRRINRELGERRRDLEQVRQLLKGQPELARDIDQLLRRLRRLDAKRLFNDPQELARLQSQIIQGLQQLELEINRALLENAQDRLRLANPDEVPPQFRSRVEEYYRALATRKQ